ncbi:hypothetical protein [Streptomyces sp. NPDC102283]|uniref:hypothetical protein n=1 Tax=Streptomyces sp. NPDC102283 TaxID=3366155 RepID=UPI003826AA36
MSASKRDALTAAVALLGALPMPVGTGPAPMTPDREQEIRTREQAATPGPWESDGAEIYGTLGGVLMVDLWVGETLDVEDQERSNADAAFMADARSAVPELLAEVDRLRAEIAELEAARTTAAAEVTRSYWLEHRRPGDTTWQRNTPGIGANWSWQSREKADQRLTEARDRWPDFEHQLIETTTTVTSKAATP